MKEVEPHIDEWIAAELSGEADAGMRASLRNWIASDPRHAEYFRKSEEAFLHTFAAGPEVIADADRAWERVKTALNQGRAGGRLKPLMQVRFALRAAAVLLLAAGLWWLLQPAEHEAMAEIRSGGAGRTDTLAPGLVVKLDGFSSIRYRADGDRLIARLEGRCFFVVTEEQSGRLEVEAGNLTIRDIGTQFSVDHRRADTTWVRVFEGSVEMKFSDGTAAILRAGEAAACLHGSREFSFPENAEALPGWQGSEVRFSQTPVIRVIRELNVAGGKPVVLRLPGADTLRISMTWFTDSREEAITVLAETLGLRLEETGEAFLLTEAPALP
jgi:transmembrane sensor